jgi:CheY-like chemotaxis protein
LQRARRRCHLARSLLEELVAAVASEVWYAANRQEALTLLREFEADVVLFDLLMPVMDGPTFLEVLRSAPRFQNVPVSVISVKDLTREARERGERRTAAILRKGNALESEVRGAPGAVLDNTERTDEA